MSHKRMTVDRALMVGKPCLIRIPVEQVLREIAGGMSMDEIHTGLSQIPVLELWSKIKDFPL